VDPELSVDMTQGRVQQLRRQRYDAMSEERLELGLGVVIVIVDQVAT
jgi:hypothetical protein